MSFSSSGGIDAPQRLAKLVLRGTNITDTGLRNVLTHIHSLRVLHLGGTRVTAAGVKVLKGALPHCRVIL